MNQNRLLSSHIIQKIQLPVKNGGNLWTCKIIKRRKSMILKLSNNRKLITEKDILWILIFRYYDSIFESGSDYSSDHGPPLAPPEVKFVTLKRFRIIPSKLFIPLIWKGSSTESLPHARNVKSLISMVFNYFVRARRLFRTPCWTHILAYSHPTTSEPRCEKLYSDPGEKILLQILIQLLKNMNCIQFTKIFLSEKCFRTYMKERVHHLSCSSGREILLKYLFAKAIKFPKLCEKIFYFENWTEILKQKCLA